SPGRSGSGRTSPARPSGRRSCAWLAWRAPPLSDLLEYRRAERVAILQVRERVAEQDPLPRIARAALLGQRAELRIVAEKPQHQRVAVRRCGVHRRAAVQAV